MRESMAGRRKRPDNVRPFRPKKARSKRKSPPRLIDPSGANADDDVVEIGYAIEWFPITRDDAASSARLAKREAKRLRVEPAEIDGGGWREAYRRVHGGDGVLSLPLALFADRSNAIRAAALPAGVIAGLNTHALMSAIQDAVAALQSSDLYAEPVDETKRNIIEDRRDELIKRGLPLGLDIPPIWRSERDDADGRVEVAITVTFEDLIGPFLHFVIGAALQAAMIVGRDVAATSTHLALRPKQRVRQFSETERKKFVVQTTHALRNLLTRAFGNKTRLRVGRRADDVRDHRAYCMRERLVNTKEFRGMKRNQRYALAKQRVMDEIISPDGGGLSASNFQRIMDKGRAIHQRVAPSAPYCESDFDPSGPRTTAL